MHEDEPTFLRRRLREESARALAADSSELKAYHDQLARLYRGRVEQLDQGAAQQPAPSGVATAAI